MLAIEAFRRAFEFSGRSSRDEFFSFFGAVLAVVLALNFLAGKQYGADVFPLMLVGLAVCAIPALSLVVRRLHDLNREPRLLWWVVVIVVANSLLQKLHGSIQYTALGPVVQWLVWASGLGMFAAIGIVLYVCSKVGDEGANSYGPAPVRVSGAPNADPAHTMPDEPNSIGNSGEVDTLTQIERLSKLRDSGVLTEDEFSTQKAALLQRL